jgi:hypothetical protein
MISETVTVMQKVELWDFLSLHNFFFHYLMVMSEDHCSILTNLDMWRGNNICHIYCAFHEIVVYRGIRGQILFGTERKSEIQYDKSLI